MTRAASFGGLLRARTGEVLRRDCRPDRPAGVHAATVSIQLLVLVGAVLLALGALSASRAYGAPTPEPDPYSAPTVTPRTPSPDPHPSGKASPAPTPTPTPAPAPEPAPVASVPRTSSSETVERSPETTTPSKKAPESRVDPTKKRAQTRTVVPLRSAGKTSKPVAGLAVPAVVASSSRRPLALGGLGLLALVAASGSLLFHLARSDEREAAL